MIAEKTLLLARHGCTGGKFHQRFFGSTDLSLDTEGRKQAEALASYVRSRNPERCFCSPLMRARQTADIVGREIGLAFDVDPDLREIDFGRWEGMSFDEIAASDPEMVRRWAAWEKDFAFPEGESVRDFLERVKRATNRMVTDSASRILLVTHGGVIRATICNLLGLRDSQHLLFGIAPASVTTIELFDGRGVLTGLNSCPYMEKQSRGPNYPDHRR